MVYPQLAPADGNTRERSVLGPSVRSFHCRQDLRLHERPGWAEIPLKPCSAAFWSLQRPPVLTGDGMRCSRFFGEVGHYASLPADVSNAHREKVLAPAQAPRRDGHAVSGKSIVAAGRATPGKTVVSRHNPGTAVERGRRNTRLTGRGTTPAARTTQLGG